MNSHHSNDILSSQFHEFGKALAPSPEQTERYNIIVKELTHLLQRNSRYRVDRIKPAGSFYKRSGIGAKMDLDIVFYLNDELPPFDDVLSTYEDIILYHQNVVEKDIRKSPYSLQFSIARGEDEIEIDLVAAPNLVKIHNRPNPDTCMEQYRQTLAIIKNLQNPQHRKFYSGALTEAAIAFVERQSGPVHELIRLAKFWKNTIFFERKVYGLSSLIEMIAVYVGMEMERYVGPRFSMSAAFERFLLTMKEIRNNPIIFSHEKMAEFGHQGFYRECDIPREVLRQRPLVLDPADPYNNRLDRCGNDFLELILTKANESLTVLREVNRSQSHSGNNGLPLLNILCPGPFSAIAAVPIGNQIRNPSNVALEEITNHNCRKPTLTTIRGNNAQKKKHAEFIMSMFDMINRSVSQLKKTTLMPSMQLQPGRQVTKSVLEHTLKVKLVSAPLLNENDFDYSLTIPLGDGRCEKMLFKW